jgi:hypothetical protein
LYFKFALCRPEMFAACCRYASIVMFKLEGREEGGKP